MSLIVKTILLPLLLSLIAFSVPRADKTQYFVHLIFNYTSGFRKLPNYFNGTAIVAFFRIPLAHLEQVQQLFLNNFALYLKDFSVFNIIIKIRCFIFRINHKLPVVSKQFELYFIRLYIGWLNLSFQHHLLLSHQFLW